MKKIYYIGGPESLTAGQAGTFRQGKFKPVSDRLAESLLDRTDVVFKEVVEGDEIPADETIDLAAAEQAAIADDEAAKRQPAADSTADSAQAQTKKRRG